MRHKSKSKGKSRRNRMKNMVGCAKNLGNSMCGNCGVNCLCGANCNCPKGCKGNCYLNRPIGKKKHGGAGCGPNGCPIPALSWARMNQFRGGASEGIFPISSVPIGSSSYGDILGVGQNGGSCGGQCAVQQGGASAVQQGGASAVQQGGASAVQQGGAFYKPGAPVPGPFVGSPWGTSINQWPGVNGVGADSNYLKNYKNVINNDPALQMKLGGKGKRNKKHKYLKRGGGIIPQDLVNLGRDLSFNFKSAYNSLNGYAAPTNPLPYKDQLMGTTKLGF
jgi:hypothetical protein